MHKGRPQWMILVLNRLTWGRGGGTTAIETPWFSFICSLLNDTASNADYIAWHV